MNFDDRSGGGTKKQLRKYLKATKINSKNYFKTEAGKTKKVSQSYKNEYQESEFLCPKRRGNQKTAKKVSQCYKN